MLPHSDLSVEALRRAPHGSAVLPDVERGEFFSRWLETRDHKADCCPDLFADARGLTAGERVLVKSATGCIEAEIEFDATLLRGVVAMTHGWGNQRSPGMSVAIAHPGVNVNALLPTGPGSFEPLSKQAFMTGIPVEVGAV